MNCQKKAVLLKNYSGNRTLESKCQYIGKHNHPTQHRRHREVEAFLHHKHGHRVPVSMQVSPVKNDSGAIVGVAEIFTDNALFETCLQRIEDAKKLAYIDSLTKIPNRRYLEQQIKSRLADFERNGNTCGILMIDIDDFKKINDTYGHSVGDSVLKMISKTMVSNSRAYDIVGRWGGDEFLVIIIGVNLINLKKIAHKYKALIYESKLFIDGKAVNVSVSVGGIILDKNYSEIELIEMVDKKLYESKKLGKNTISI